MFSSKHLQQSVHLSNEAIKELNKAHQDQINQAYIVDCYLSSLDYFIGALPDDLNLNDLPGSGHRQILLRSKFGNLFNSQNGSSSSFSDITSSNQPTSQSSWKSYFMPTILTRQSRSNQKLIEPNIQESKIEEAQELSIVNEKGKDLSSTKNQDIEDHSSWNSKCKCGREISIKIPNCLIQETNPSQSSNQSIHHWTNLILSIMISTILWIKNSRFYQYLKEFFYKSIHFIIQLESQFKLVEKGLYLVGDLIEMMIKLDEEFGLWNRFIKGFVWMFELILRIFLVFTIKGIEGYQDSNRFRLLSNQDPSQFQPHPHSHPKVSSSATSLDQLNQTKLIYLHQSLINRFKSLSILKSN